MKIRVNLFLARKGQKRDMNSQKINNIMNIGFRFGVLLVGLVVSSANAEVVTQEQALATVKAIGTKSGCMACHAIDGARIGPSYKDVAAKYANPDATVKKYLEGKSSVDYLMGKVREGTKIGKNKHWDKDPKSGRAYGMMTANPKGRISDENLKTLLEAILALK